MKFNITEKVGPLPVWAWGVIVAGGALAVYYVFYRKGDDAAVNAMGASTIDGTVGYQTSGLTGAGSAVEPDLTTQSNLTWLGTAGKGIAGMLGVSPVDVTAALTKYLQGMELSSKEKKWIDEAITRYGQPPEGLQGISPIIADPTDAAKPIKGVTQNIVGSAVSAVYADGTRGWLSAAAYRALGSPKPTWTSPSGSPIVRYVTKPGGKAVYAVAADGERIWLSAAHYKRAGSPATTAEVF